jgi:peroxiredoxin
MKNIVFQMILALACVSFAFAQQEEVINYTKVGQPMPAFSVTDLNGSQFSISEAKGKVVVVFFWTTWCPYCRQEMPYLEQQVWQKYKSEDFLMIGIAREQSKETVSGFLKKNKFTFPMAADPEGEIFDLFANRGVPRSYVVDRNGKILFQSVGLETEEFARRNKIIEQELKKIKKEKTGK